MLSSVVREVGGKGLGRPFPLIAHRIPLTKLAELDVEIFLYLAALMIIALARLS